MSTSIVAFLLAPFAWRRKGSPAQSTFAQVTEKRAPQITTLADLRARQIDNMLEHIELYVLAAKFADWMREGRAHGVYLSDEIDDAVALFCDARNYYCPNGDQLRGALGPTHGVTKKRVWRSSPLLEGKLHLTDAQRPYLYIIDKEPPKSRVFQPTADPHGRWDDRDRSSSDGGPQDVRTGIGRLSDGAKKKRPAQRVPARRAA